MNGGGNGSSRDPAEQRLLRRLRVVAALTVLALLVFAVAVDTLGRLFIDASFHVDNLVIGGLLGAVMLSAGVAGISGGIQLPGGWEVRKQPPPYKPVDPPPPRDEEK